MCKTYGVTVYAKCVPRTDIIISVVVLGCVCCIGLYLNKSCWRSHNFTVILNAEYQLYSVYKSAQLLYSLFQLTCFCRQTVNKYVKKNKTASVVSLTVTCVSAVKKYLNVCRLHTGNTTTLKICLAQANNYNIATNVFIMLFWLWFWNRHNCSNSVCMCVCVRCCLIPFISAVLPPVQETLLSRIAPGQSKLFYNRTCMHWNMSPLIRCFAQHILKVFFLKTYIYKLYDNILSLLYLMFIIALINSKWLSN